MYIGSLLEVMGLDEALMTARQSVGSRAKASGRPLGMVAMTQKELMDKAKRNMSPKDYKKFEDSVKADAATKIDPVIQQMYQGVKDKRSGINTPEAQYNWELNKQLKQYAKSIGMKRTDPAFKDRLIQDSLAASANQRLPGDLGALAFPGQDIIVANKNSYLGDAINNDTVRINPNSKLIKHELQHIAQGRANDAVDKYYGLAPGTTSKAYKDQYADLGMMSNDNAPSDVRQKENLKYITDPYEYDSNVTGTSKAKPGVRGSTIRIAKQLVGKGLNPLNPTFGRGETLNRKIFDLNDSNETPVERRKRSDQIMQDKLGQYRHTPGETKKVTAEMRRKEKAENEKIAATAKQVGDLYDVDGTIKGRQVKRTGTRPNSDNPTVMKLRQAQEKLKQQQINNPPQQVVQQLNNSAPTMNRMKAFVNWNNANNSGQNPFNNMQQTNSNKQLLTHQAVQPMRQVASAAPQQPQQIVQQPAQQQVIQQPVQQVQPVVQQTVTPQSTQPVQPQPSGVVQPKPYANAYNNKLDPRTQRLQRMVNGVQNRNTGITYFKKNGKLMSTAMQ